MNILRKLLRTVRQTRQQLNRGLSTAELVGIIVVVGILGSLGATYITGLVNSANDNTGNQNAVTLSTLANSYLTSGGAVATFGSPISANTAITALNTGISSGTPPISYQMTPPIANIASYTVAADPVSGMITFSHVAGDAP